MQIVLKLLFDLSVYYTVVGFFVSMLLGEGPSWIGFLCLLLPPVTAAIIRKFTHHGNVLQRASIGLPLIFLLFHPELSQFLLILPPYIYLGWCIWKNRLGIDYTEAKMHFSFGLKLLLLLIFGLPFWKKLPMAVGSTVPYLVLMLSSGVSLLRMLRENRSVGIFQCFFIGSFLVCCAALTLGKVPQLLAKGIGAVYLHVIVPIAKYIIFAIAWIANLAAILLKKLLLHNTATNNESLTIDTAEEMMGLDHTTFEPTAELEWLRIVLIVFAILVVAFFIIWIFRKIAGNTESEDNDNQLFEKSEKIVLHHSRSGKGLFLRPTNPRAAVRYYYAKFLHESRKRGIIISNGMTVSERSLYCAYAFSGSDPSKLAAVYLPARYSEKETITSAQVDQAAAAWAELKAAKKSAEADERFF